MSIEALEHTTQIVSTGEGLDSSLMLTTDMAEFPTPLLDSIVPPSESVDVRSTRAMLLRLGETAAGVRLADVATGDDVSPEVIEAHLKHSVGLFLADVGQAGYGIVFDREGEVVSSNRLLDELAMVTEEKARKARLAELREQLAGERAQLESTEAEIARLAGDNAVEAAPVRAAEAIGADNVIDFHEEVAKRRGLGMGALRTAMVGIFR